MVNNDIGPAPKRRGTSEIIEASDEDSYDGLDPKVKPQAIADCFKIHSMADIAASSGKEPPWIVGLGDNAGLIPERDLVVLAARAKGTKSWLGLSLCLSMPLGVNWLNFETRRANTVFVNFELSEKTLAYRVKRTSGALGIDLSELDRKICIASINRSELYAELRSLWEDGAPKGMYAFQALEQIRRVIQASGLEDIGLIVFDSFYNIAGDIDENRASDVAMIYRLIRGLCEEFDCAGMVIHHFSKGDPGAKMAGERGAGSRVHRQEPATYIELTPHAENGCVVFTADVRDYKPIMPFGLRWVVPLLVPDSDLDPEDIKRPGSKRKSDEGKLDEVLELLEDRPLTTVEWRDEAKSLKVSRASFYRIKSKLEAREEALPVNGKWSICRKDQNDSATEVSLLTEGQNSVENQKTRETPKNNVRRQQSKP